ncbi:MAG: anhydro-N-acetylmuramic acid kinase, partial [Alphaproteobacteria bacterium]
MKRKVRRLYKAVGLMSGTSMDGVDAVLVRTDGENHVELLGKAFVAYPPALKARAMALAKGESAALDEVLRVEQAITRLYVKAVRKLGSLKGVEVVGMHGQTIRHLPQEGLTWQLGDAHLLAELVGVPVVSDFRRRDMAAGGQGAPLVPLFHKAVLVGLRSKVRGQRKEKDVAVLNLGGVANLTYFGPKGEILAADCGPGVGLCDLWMQRWEKKAFDRNGRIALLGMADKAVVAGVMKDIGFFGKKLPRSAHRHEFDGILNKVIGTPDGMATLCAITAAGVAQTLKLMKVKAQGLPVV